MASAITAHTRAVVAVLLSVTICLPACSPATATDPCNADYETPATFDPVLAAQLQTALDAKLAASGAPGASLTVHIPGQGTFAAGAGMRDILAGEPVLPRTRFRVDLYEGIQEGDYIEFGTLGAYGLATATRFNGYGDHKIVAVEHVLEM